MFQKEDGNYLVVRSEDSKRFPLRSGKPKPQPSRRFIYKKNSFMKIINLTPHAITIVDESGNVLRNIDPEAKPARLKVSTVQAHPIDGVPTSKTVFGEPENLPEQKWGVYLIVSQLIKSALPERTDLLVPAEVVRDEKGNVVGCRSLGL